MKFFSFLSVHRLKVIGLTILGIGGLYVLQNILWPIGKNPETQLEVVWSWGSVLWLSALLPGTMGLLGLLAFSYPKDLDKVKKINKLVSLRIVSRGTNVEALTKTILRCRREMKENPLFPYIIEVVIDTKSKNMPRAGKDLRYIVVPKRYQTSNFSLYKARALHFALEHSPLPNKAWIVHLDEETQLTTSGIKGICAMIREEEKSKNLRIGQGAILYHRNWEEHPFLTLADNVRTGDDLARFHLQHKLGVTIFGLHGSYIVVRNDIEKAIGFDFGPNGSITEDAFWALVAMESGKRCRWVEGYLEEQSTQSVKDFIKQRRRWFMGLAKVSLYAPVKRTWRIPLGINTVLWALAPITALYTLFHFFYGFTTSPILRFLANYSLVSFAVLYFIGLEINLNEHKISRKLNVFIWHLVQLVLFPFFSFMESAGVLLAVFRPVAGFHVVKK